MVRPPHRHKHKAKKTEVMVGVLSTPGSYAAHSLVRGWGCSLRVLGLTASETVELCTEVISHPGLLLGRASALTVVLSSSVGTQMAVQGLAYSIVHIQHLSLQKWGEKRKTKHTNNSCQMTKIHNFRQSSFFNTVNTAGKTWFILSFTKMPLKSLDHRRKISHNVWRGKLCSVN